MTVNVLDLFSGIGGFSLGLERAGMRTVAFCEIDPFCRAVLRKHWPDIPCYDDIRTMPAVAANIVTAGFPCQPGSSAARGRDKGRNHSLWLWPEVPRVLQASGASWFIGENVTHLDKKPWLALDQVVSDLEAIGFTVGPPLEIPACAVGYDHRRSRLWILGYSDRYRKSGLSVDAEASRLSGNRSDAGSSRAADGVSGSLDRHRKRAIGNAVVPQIPEIIGKAIMRAEGLT